MGSHNHSVRFMGSGWWHSTLMGSGGKPHHVPTALPALGSRSGWAPRSYLFIYPRNSSGRAQACAVRLWWGRNIPETRPTSPALQPDHRHPVAMPARPVCPGCPAPAFARPPAPGAHGRHAVVQLAASSLLRPESHWGAGTWVDVAVGRVRSPKRGSGEALGAAGLGLWDLQCPDVIPPSSTLRHVTAAMPRAFQAPVPALCPRRGEWGRFGAAVRGQKGRGLRQGRVCVSPGWAHLGSPPCPCPALAALTTRLLEVWGSFCGAAGVLRSLLPAPSRHAPCGEAPASLALGASPVPPGRPRCSEGALQWTWPYGGRDTVLGVAGLAWYKQGADPHPCPTGTVTAPLCHPPGCTGLSTPGSISGGCHALGKATLSAAHPQQAAAGPRGVREHPTPLLGTQIPLHRGGQWDMRGGRTLPPRGASLPRAHITSSSGEEAPAARASPPCALRLLRAPPGPSHSSAIFRVALSAQLSPRRRAPLPPP